MQKRPTHSTLTRFVSELLPAKQSDVSLLYHVPRHPRYHPEHSSVDKVVLSVTPTQGVYDEISYRQSNRDTAWTETNAPHAHAPRPPRIVCFLHRPFTLDRRRVRRGTLVLSSHTSFDENLTVGWNTALASRLGINVQDSVCVQGYKGDPERKIGIIGPVQKPQAHFLHQLKQEFGCTEHVQESAANEVRVVAIMNAFHVEEVERVMELARHHGWISSVSDGRNILYLTGQPRESGLAAATELGMAVVCVGHRVAEEWGIRFLGTQLRSAYPGLEVQEVCEEEEPREKREKRVKRPDPQ